MQGEQRFLLLPSLCFLMLLHHLTFSHTIFTFHDTKKESFWKHCGKRRKCWLPAFPPFPTMFSTHSITNFDFWVMFILLSAPAFNLEWSKILLFDRDSKATKVSHGIILFYSCDLCTGRLFDQRLCQYSVWGLIMVIVTDKFLSHHCLLFLRRLWGKQPGLLTNTEYW